jgi:glycosyltransferase involved in cell wall biosynthesis
MSENQEFLEGEVPNQVPQDVLLSVCIITYNHERYIREALDSALAQQTDFPFEICLGEDQSKDDTRQICLEYAEKYPTKIRLFLRDEEDKIFINGIKSGRYNSIETRKAARGKYIALCEGDDYWTDPLKLQKQVDLLDADPSLSACVHRTKVVAESDAWSEEVFPELPSDGKLRVLDALNHSKMFAATGSLVFRKFKEPSSEWTTGCFMGDRIIFAALTAINPIAILPDVMSVYRRHDGGACAQFLMNKGALLGLQSRLVYFQNIGELVGDAPEVEAKRIEMLRYFTRAYASHCINLPGLTLRGRLSGLMDCFLRRAYWMSFFRRGSLREMMKLGAAAKKLLRRT